MITVHGRKGFQVNREGRAFPAVDWEILGPVNGRLSVLCSGQTGPVPSGRWGSTGGSASASELRQQAQAFLLLAAVLDAPDDYAPFVKD